MVNFSVSCMCYVEIIFLLILCSHKCGIIRHCFLVVVCTLAPKRWRQLLFLHYSYSYISEYKDDSILKGIKKGVKNNEINFEDYENCLSGEKYKDEITQNILKIVKHKICLQSVTKKTMDVFDDKRNYTSNTESVPYGYPLDEN